jgi:glycerophosphoryl diester phosphodiesterase
LTKGARDIGNKRSGAFWRSGVPCVVVAAMVGLLASSDGDRTQSVRMSPRTSASRTAAISGGSELAKPQSITPQSPPCPDVFRPRRSVEVIAHRGASGIAPENTLSAFQFAADMGADWLEMDVQRTRDGVLVVIHDTTVDRTTNGHGRVVDLDLAQLGALDAGSWFSPKFVDERIPTLREVLDLAREARIRVFPEIKQPGLYPGIETQLVHALRAAGMDQCALVTSFDRGSLQRVHALAPSIPLALCSTVEPSTPPEGTVVLCPSVATTLAAPELVSRVHAAGLRVWPFTLDGDAQMQALIAIGVDGFVTGFLREAIDEVGSR